MTDNSQIYAIGDVHGCLDKLERLVRLCMKDSQGRASFIFIGDYIDRGADSAGVIRFLIKLQAALPGRVICLLGNHEDLALEALGSSDGEEQWLINGGDATLRSYGINTPADIPRDHIDWLRSLPFTHDDGLRFFVHAGVRPGRPLNEQTRHDLLWMREPFLSSDHDFGRFIVHGHTPVDWPDLRENRLNIDTGAVFGGNLTAAIFNNASVKPIGFLQDA